MVSGAFYCEFNVFLIFAIDIMYIPTYALVQETDGGLRAVVTIRYSIACLVRFRQALVFVQIDHANYGLIDAILPAVGNHS